MKKHISLFALLMAASLPLRAETPATTTPAAEPAKTPADLDYDAVWAIYNEEPTKPNLMKEDPRAYYQWVGEKFQRFCTAARDFAAKYPHDPRRWEAIVQSSYTRPMWITGFKDGFDAHPGWGGLIEDEAKVAAFKAGQKKLFAQLQASTDATLRQRTGAYGALITEALSAYEQHKTPANKAAYVALVDEFIAKVPDGITMVAKQHIGFLKYEGTKEELAAFLQRLESSKVPAVQQMVAEGRGDFKRFAGVAELKFTAADGREVDLAKLRGKVVLVDFWATWCGPCKAEIPNVVANYHKYHAQGFEVIGVTLENPGLAPKDTAEQKAAKLAKAKDVMLAFTRENGMPWPQYFDGKWWKNDLAAKFGIDAIPAMVLLDQSGQVVSIDARGPQLEGELKRLLKL